MNTDDITLPLEDDAPISDAPTTEPLLKELLADVRALATRFAAFETEARARWAADDAFKVRVEQRLDRLDERLEDVDAQLQLLHHDQTRIRTEDIKFRDRLQRLEQKAA